MKGLNAFAKSLIFDVLIADSEEKIYFVNAHESLKGREKKVVRLKATFKG